MPSRGPGRDSADRVHIPQTGLMPGEVASSELADKLHFSYDWVEALGWRDPPAPTLAELLQILTYTTTQHGYRIGPDRDKRGPSDYQNNGAKMVGCKCGGGAPCAEFERLRLLFAALGFGEGHNPLGNGLALAKVKVDAANAARVQAEERHKRIAARIEQSVADRTRALQDQLEAATGIIDSHEAEIGKLIRMFQRLNVLWAETEDKRNTLSGLLRRMAHRSIAQNRHIRALEGKS